MLPDPDRPDVTRRAFLKATASFAAAGIAGSQGAAATSAGRSGAALVVAPDDPVASSAPAVWAAGELKAALETKGAPARLVSRVGDAAPGELCIVVGGVRSPLARDLLRQRRVTVPAEAESLCLLEARAEGRPVLLAAGADALGLVYALTELADRVRCLPAWRAALAVAAPVVERPASRTRSMLRAFSSEVEDRGWFHDRDFWRTYLSTLVSCRLNRFSLAMGMGYNSASGITDGYLVFPYPFFAAVPGYGVRAAGLGDEERSRNLATLKFVGEEAARRGLRFQLGIWTLAYRWPNSPEATYRIEGLTDATHAAYCRDALAVLLSEVPAITGVTFRVHEESGIPRGEESFWKTQFDALARCGRRVEIDMHAKNMAPQTLEFALDTGQPVVISPKYCGEHMGLPYHQAAIRETEMVPADSFTDTGTGVLRGNRSFTRNGYGDLLAENRTWDVVYRIWPGTQRFLLSGDPATFAAYGREASFCGAAGIELSEPLVFKGRQGSGLPGGRCAYADVRLAPRHDFEKYLYTYRLWGRLGYSPGADPEVWRRALRRDFGPAAVEVERALGPASRVLPLVTMAHGQAADCQSYWPEIYANMMIADEQRNQAFGDTRAPRLFGNVSPFDPQLFQSPDECAEALLAGHPTGKYSPLDVAHWLEDIAAATATHLAAARAHLGAGASEPAFRRVEEDVLIQRGLALFFAGKLRAAVLWRIFAVGGSQAAGEAAIARYVEGRNAWAAMAERAASVYRSSVTYGANLRGHWLDRVAGFDEDIADLRRRLEAPPAHAGGADRRAADRALKLASARPVRPRLAVQHTPAAGFRSGEPLPIALRCGPRTPRRVLLHYRHVNQAERWQATGLRREGDGFLGEVPAAYTAHRYPLQYYFEVETGPARAALFPRLDADLASVPYFVVRRAA